MSTVTCPSCAKSYRWKPELAGKRVKCKCGQVIAIPAAEPVATASESAQQDIYGMSESDAPAPQRRTGAAGGTAVAPARVIDESNQYRCPYCGQDLTPGSPLCVYCGTNLRAGRDAPAPAAAPPPGIGPVAIKRPRRVESDDDGAMKKKLIVGGVFVVMLVIGAIIGLKMFAPAGGSGTTASGKKLVGHDAEVLAQIKDEYGTEAKKWLEKNPAHQVMGLSTKQAEYKIDQFYQMGAKQVIAFGNGISTTLAVELPEDPAKRKEIFAWQAKWHKEYGFEVEKDIGQNWLTIKMHI